MKLVLLGNLTPFAATFRGGKLAPPLPAAAAEPRPRTSTFGHLLSAVFAAGPLLPPQNIWADQLIVDGARLPMFKFPRHAEGVTECGGGPCP